MPSRRRWTASEPRAASDQNRSSVHLVQHLKADADGKRLFFGHALVGGQIVELRLRHGGATLDLWGSKLMALVSAVSAIAILAASVSSTPASTRDRELVIIARSNLFEGCRCIPATHPGGGPSAAYFELRLLKARMEAAVDLLNEFGEEIDLAQIENDLSDALRGVYFVNCKPKDTYSAKARRSFKDNVLELEKRALAAAVEGPEIVADHDGNGVISTEPPHID